MTDPSTALTSKDDPTPRVRITGPAALVGTIPALLGFHPTESLVVVFIDSNRIIQCTMRIDLTEGVISQTDRVVDIAGRAGADTVTIVIYSAQTGEALPWADEVTAANERLTRMGIAVREALHVDQGRFHSYLCDSQSCCPAEGTVVEATVSELEAHRILGGGLAVLPSRQDAAAAYRLRPDLTPSGETYDHQRVALGAALADRCTTAVADLLDLAVGDDSDDTQARLAMLLGDVIVRDYLLAVLARDHADLRPAAEAMTHLALSTIESHRPPVAVTAACLHMVNGDNPVAVWALLDLAEGESFAGLLRQTAEYGVPPGKVRDLLVEALPVIEVRSPR